MIYHRHDKKFLPSDQPGTLWRNSYFGQLVDCFGKQSNRIWVWVLGKLRFEIQWQGIIEGVIILSVVFMPVLSSWGLLLPFLLLLEITGPVRNTRASRVGWLFLWLVLLISAWLSPGFPAGFPVLLKFGSWFGMAWLIGRTFSAAMKERILKYLVYSSLIWLIAGFWQLFSGIPTPRGWLGLEQAVFIPVRIYSVFGNPNIFALYLLSILVICRYLILQCSLSIEKYLLAGVLLLILAALYFTYTRMAWLLAVIILVFQADRNRWRLIILVGGIMVFLFMTFPDFNLRLGSLANLHDSSLQYRLQIWRGTGKALRDFWLWGAGPGSFQTIYPQYQIGSSVSQHAHQFYLQFWLEHGLFGLMALLVVLKRVLTGHWRVKASSVAMKTLAMVLIVFLVYGFSETWYIQSFSGGYFWFITGVLQASKRDL